MFTYHRQATVSTARRTAKTRKLCKRGQDCRCARVSLRNFSATFSGDNNRRLRASICTFLGYRPQKIDFYVPAKISRLCVDVTLECGILAIPLEAGLH